MPGLWEDLQEPSYQTDGPIQQTALTVMAGAWRTMMTVNAKKRLTPAAWLQELNERGVYGTAKITKLVQLEEDD